MLNTYFPWNWHEALAIKIWKYKGVIGSKASLGSFCVPPVSPSPAEGTVSALGFPETRSQSDSSCSSASPSVRPASCQGPRAGSCPTPSPSSGGGARIGTARSGLLAVGFLGEGGMSWS